MKNILPTLLIFLMLTGSIINAQTLPVISVRFANPTYDCPTQTYCLDVEFMSDTENQQLFGMNVRFFYDDNILEYLAMGDFAEGYNITGAPQIETYDPSAGAFFGLAGPPEWINGSVQLQALTTSVYLSTTEWTKLFNVCFHVDDPNSLQLHEFCPSIIWDLQENPPEDGGGYLQGDDGVVITVVDPDPFQESAASTENVVQFNWEYNFTGSSVGQPVSVDCTSTFCGYIIPVSNWALFLGIGLMIIATFFIYRRRLSA